ncbi:hypothetical protein ACH40E_01065 [Streptomyces acidicola]
MTTTTSARPRPGDALRRTEVVAALGDGLKVPADRVRCAALAAAAGARP